MARKNVKFKSNIKKVKKSIIKKSKKGLREVGKHLKSSFKEKLSGERTGRRYWVPELGRYYTASAPGEFPAHKLGNLKKSLGYKVDDDLTLFFGANVPYAESLEVKRPFMRRGMIEETEAIKSMIGRAFF